MPIKHTQVLILTVVFLLHYFFERLYPQRPELNDWKNERFNLLIGLLNIILNILPAGLLVQWLSYIEDHQLGLLQVIQLPPLMETLLIVLLLDAWMYAWHRLNHTAPFLWRFHRFHHLDEKMNTTTSVRFHFMELLLSAPGKAVVYLLVGASFIPVILYEILFFCAIVLHHSNIRISQKVDGFYRLLFSSPIMHRIHHSRLQEETRSNYGALFSFWDRLFHSFRNTPKGELRFGTDE